MSQLWLAVIPKLEPIPIADMSAMPRRIRNRAACGAPLGWKFSPASWRPPGHLQVSMMPGGVE
jgi:hypothetical protein